jgi:2-polyprenyl-3-methyl-5-hydroxy-6-metoxy-1,4-benzoquinol methylase
LAREKRGLILESVKGLVRCPACNSQNVQNYTIYNGHLLDRCDKCGLVFTEQRQFSTAQYEDVYSGVTAYRRMIDDARQTYEGKKGYRDLWWFKRMGLRWVHSYVSSGQLLDIGSGPGTLLLVARREFGFEVQGIEPASAAAAIANELGAPTYCGTIEQFEKQSSKRFEAITSFEVIEHVSDPLSILTAARTLLKPNGLLILSVPNLDDPYCLQQQIPPATPPIHINFFSRRSLNALLERSGFELNRSFTLPIPTSSVRNVHGKYGFILRLPSLGLRKIIGMVDGTTLLIMATPIRV